MRYEVLLRSRALKHQTIRDKHERFMSGLRQIDAPWGLAGGVGPPPPDPGSELIADVKLGPFLGAGIRGEVVYQFRRDFRDDASQDDYFSLTFNPAKVDFRCLVDEVFPRYIDCFDAYRGELGDADFAHLDFDQAREVDCRHGVFRVYPVAFFDRQLCLRAFQLESEEIGERLAPLCERVIRHGDGVLVVLARTPLALDDADRASRCLRDALMKRKTEGPGELWRGNPLEGADGEAEGGGGDEAGGRE